jgi:Leu/Phe-tRNA-protein transferase
MQQTQLVDTGGEAPHVANLGAVPFPDADDFEPHC